MARIQSAADLINGLSEDKLPHNLFLQCVAAENKQLADFSIALDHWIQNAKAGPTRYVLINGFEIAQKCAQMSGREREELQENTVNKILESNELIVIGIDNLRDCGPVGDALSDRFSHGSAYRHSIAVSKSDKMLAVGWFLKDVNPIFRTYNADFRNVESLYSGEEVSQHFLERLPIESDADVPDELETETVDKTETDQMADNKAENSQAVTLDAKSVQDIAKAIRETRRPPYEMAIGIATVIIASLTVGTFLHNSVSSQVTALQEVIDVNQESVKQLLAQSDRNVAGVVLGIEKRIEQSDKNTANLIRGIEKRLEQSNAAAIRREDRLIQLIKASTDGSK